MSYPVCLTIAGSDSGGEAGIQADLTTFRDFNCHGLSAITATTAQNPQKILSLNPSSKKCLEDQISALDAFFDLKFIKTGLLPSIEAMEVILNSIPEKSILITDPLIASTSGTTIMNNETLKYFKNTFSKRIDYITPNLPEAEILVESKFSPESISSLFSFARKGVYLKGGHSIKPGVDYFTDGNSTWLLECPEIEIKSSHGTGCRISSGLCAALATGQKALNSAVLAKNYVYHSLKSCRKISTDKWLMCSPGNILTLQNKVTLKELT